MSWAASAGRPALRSRARRTSRPGRSVHCVGVAIRPRSEAKRCRLNSSNGTCGRSVDGHGQLARLRIRDAPGDELGVDPEAARHHEHAVLVRPASVRRSRATRSAARPAPACRCRSCRSSSCRGSWPGPRCRSSASASVQASLAVGRVGVDRDAHRQAQGRRCEGSTASWRGPGTGRPSAACPSPRRCRRVRR